MYENHISSRVDHLQVIEDGAIDLDLGLDVHYYDYGGIFPKFSSDMKVRSAPISTVHSCVEI